MGCCVVPAGTVSCSLCRKWWDRWTSPPKDITLLVLGLDNAGKTVISRKLVGKPIENSTATVGLNLWKLRYRKCNIMFFDLGGGKNIRDIWKVYYADAHGIIFVVDASDLARMPEAKAELMECLEDEHTGGKPILLLGNKQDMESALDEIDILTELDLEVLVNENRCPTRLEICSALNGHHRRSSDRGIRYGLKWLVETIKDDYWRLNAQVEYCKDIARQEEEKRREERLRLIDQESSKAEKGKRLEEKNGVRPSPEGMEGEGKCSKGLLGNLPPLPNVPAASPSMPPVAWVTAEESPISSPSGRPSQPLKEFLETPHKMRNFFKRANRIGPAELSPELDRMPPLGTSTDHLSSSF